MPRSTNAELTNIVDYVNTGSFNYETNTIDPTSSNIREPNTVWYNSETGAHFVSSKSEEFVPSTADTSTLTPNTTINLLDDDFVEIFQFGDDLTPGVPIIPPDVKITKITIKNVNFTSTSTNRPDIYIFPLASDPVLDFGTQVDEDDNFFFFGAGTHDLEFFPSVEMTTAYKLVIYYNRAGGTIPATDVSGTIYPELEFQYVSTTTTQEFQLWSRIDDKQLVTSGFIYFNTVAGNDAYDGLTPSTPVQSETRLQELLDKYCFVSNDLEIVIQALGTNDNIKLNGSNISLYWQFPVDTLGADGGAVTVTFPAVVGNDNRIELRNFYKLRLEGASVYSGTSSPLFSIQDNAKVRCAYCTNVDTNVIEFTNITDQNEALSFYDCGTVDVDRVLIDQLTGLSSGRLINANGVRRFTNTNKTQLTDSSTSVIDVFNFIIWQIRDAEYWSIEPSANLKMRSGTFVNASLSTRTNWDRIAFDELQNGYKVLGGGLTLPSSYYSTVNSQITAGIALDTDFITLDSTVENLGFHASHYNILTTTTPGNNKLYLPGSAFQVKDGAELRLENSSTSTETIEIFDISFLGFHFDIDTPAEYDASDDVRYYPYTDTITGIATISTTNSITGANGDDVLYQTGVTGTGTWQQSLDYLVNGDQYRITFKCAEIDPAITGSGQRVMTFEVDNVVQGTIDIYDLAGGNDIATDVQFTFTADGLTSLELIPTTGTLLIQSFKIEPLESIGTLAPGQIGQYLKFDDEWREIGDTYLNTTSGLTADTKQAAIDELTLRVNTLPSSAEEYYVRPDGDDGNNGLANTAGSAFATLDAALANLLSFNGQGQRVTIWLEDNTIGTPYSTLGFNASALKDYKEIIVRSINGNASCYVEIGFINFAEFLFTDFILRDLRFADSNDEQIEFENLAKVTVQGCRFDNAFSFVFTNGVHATLVSNDFNGDYSGSLVLRVRENSYLELNSGNNFDDCTFDASSAFVESLINTTVDCQADVIMTGKLATVTDNSHAKFTVSSTETVASVIDDSSSVNFGSTVRNYSNTTSGLTAFNKQAAIDEIVAGGLIKGAYASDAAAGSGGVVTGELYQTDGLGTGIFANTGVVMVKQ